MGLKIQRRVTTKARVITTLIAVFALIAQPGYSFVAGQVAHALSGSEGLSATALTSATTCGGWSNALVVTATAGADQGVKVFGKISLNSSNPAPMQMQYSNPVITAGAWKDFTFTNGVATYAPTGTGGFALNNDNTTSVRVDFTQPGTYTYTGQLVKASDGTTPIGQPFSETTTVSDCAVVDTTSHVSFNTIQEAVNAASTNDIIKVAPGVYTGSIDITKPLTINGANNGTSGFSNRVSESTITGQVNVNANSVVINGFSFTNHAGQVNITSTMTRSGIVLENNIFDGYSSVGVPTSNAGNLIVQNNLFKNVSVSGESLQIKANSDQGGCDGTQVLNNSFVSATNNGGSDVNLSCTGSNSTNITVSGNSSTGNSGDSSFVGISGVSGINVADNTATTSGTAIYFFGSMNGVASITGNHIHGTSGAVGVSNGAYDASRSSTGVFTVTNNDFSNNATGMSIASNALSGAGAVTANQNNLSGNATGVDNSGSTPINATNNWWGTANGPKDTVYDTSIPATNAGSGAQALGAVQYGSWCVTASCSVFSDTTLAAPSNLSPDNDTYTHNNKFDNTWSPVANALKYEYSTTYVVNGTTKTYSDFSMGSNYSTTPTLVTRHNGMSEDATYTWKVRTYNQAGVPGPWSGDTNVTVDTKPPLAVTLTAPTNNTVQKSNDFYFTWNAPVDTGSVLHYEFQSSQSSSAANGALNSGVWKSVDSSNPEQNDLTTPMIHSTGAQGVWYWQVRAVDAAGKQGPWSPIWKMTIDQQPPVGQITSIGGVNYTGTQLNVKSTNGILVITGTAQDNIAMNRIGVQLIKPGVSGDVQYLYANNNGLYGKEGLVNWQAEFDITALALADGAYGLNISYVDKVGNVVTEKAFFTLDNTRPVVAFAAPLDFSKPFQSLPVITITASDATSGLNGTPVIHVYNSDGTPTAAWCSALSCDTSMLTDGDYSVKAGINDKSGNNQTITANFTIDSIAPVVSINKPAATTASLPLTLTGNVTGSPTSLSIFNGTTNIGNVDSADIASNGDWSYKLPAGLAQGSYTLSVVATDAAGNSSSASTSPASVTTFTVGPFQSSTQGSDDSLKAPDPIVTTAPTGARVASSFISAVPTPADPPTVLGTQTAKDAVLGANDKVAAIAPSTQGWKIFGVAWYWWLIILAAVAAIMWWIVAAARRRSENA